MAMLRSLKRFLLVPAAALALALGSGAIQPGAAMALEPGHLYGALPSTGGCLIGIHVTVYGQDFCYVAG